MVKVKKEGKRREDEYFLIYYLPSELAKSDSSPPRLCFSVEKEVRKATERNLLKRRMREVYRRHKDVFSNGFLYLIRAKERALTLPFTTFQERLLSLIERCS